MVGASCGQAVGMQAGCCKRRRAGVRGTHTSAPPTPPDPWSCTLSRGPAGSASEVAKTCWRTGWTWLICSAPELAAAAHRKLCSAQAWSACTATSAGTPARTSHAESLAAFHCSACATARTAFALLEILAGPEPGIWVWPAQCLKKLATALGHGSFCRSIAFNSMAWCKSRKRQSARQARRVKARLKLRDCRNFHTTTQHVMRACRPTCWTHGHAVLICPGVCRRPGRATWLAACPAESLHELYIACRRKHGPAHTRAQLTSISCH